MRLWRASRTHTLLMQYVINYLHQFLCNVFEITAYSRYASIHAFKVSRSNLKLTCKQSLSKTSSNHWQRIDGRRSRSTLRNSSKHHNGGDWHLPHPESRGLSENRQGALGRWNQILRTGWKSFLLVMLQTNGQLLGRFSTSFSPRKLWSTTIRLSRSHTSSAIDVRTRTRESSTGEPVLDATVPSRFRLCSDASCERCYTGGSWYVSGPSLKRFWQVLVALE